MSGRKADEDTGCIETKGSCSSFHMAKVPPCALDLTSGSSGSYLSSELSAHLYSPWKGFIASSRSFANIWGSLRKIKSTLCVLVKCFRLRALRKKPSIFQVKEENDLEEGSDEESTEGVEEEASTCLYLAVYD